MESMDKLRVSWATLAVTWKSVRMVGRAGSKICMDAGPNAEAADRSTISPNESRGILGCINVFKE